VKGTALTTGGCVSMMLICGDEDADVVDVAKGQQEIWTNALKDA
jgi:hypothetical protein